MTTLDHERGEAQQRFERTLLDSAASDGLAPGATEAAWDRFSSLMAAAAVSGGVPVVAAASASGWARFARLAAAKQLLLGALTGSALTFAWLGATRSHRAQETTANQAPRTLAIPSAVRLPETDGQASANRITPAPLLGAHRAPRAGSSVQLTHRREPPRAPADAPAAAESPEGAPSTLAAEVAALDAARAAARAGAYPQALALLDQYRADFPHGALRADVEVASIEAIYAQGSRREALQRAARFLAESPNDPHSAMIRRLIGQ